MFEMFGPYHVARLNAAAAVGEVVGVEGSAQSSVYGWDQTHGSERFARLTLFDDEPIERKITTEIEHKISSTLDALRPCVVAVPGWQSRWSLCLLHWAMRHEVPAIMMSASTAEDAPRFWWKERIKRQIIGGSHAALVGGSRHAAYMKQLGMSDEYIFAGYDVVDNEHFRRGANKARADAVATRKRLQLPSRYLLASARFIAKKNLPALIESYGAATRGRAGPPHLVLLGSGRERSAVEDAIAKHGLAERVHLPGFLGYDVLPMYYGLAEGFVHVSLTEQWGLVINEAMASGLPVVASRTCGAAPDLVEDGVNGFLVDPGSIESMSTAIATLIDLPQDKRELMGAASRRIIANWAPERFASALMLAAEAARAAPARRLLAPWDRALVGALARRTIAGVE